MFIFKAGTHLGSCSYIIFIFSKRWAEDEVCSISQCFHLGRERKVLAPMTTVFFFVVYLMKIILLDSRNISLLFFLCSSFYRNAIWPSSEHPCIIVFNRHRDVHMKSFHSIWYGVDFNWVWGQSHHNILSYWKLHEVSLVRFWPVLG